MKTLVPVKNHKIMTKYPPCQFFCVRKGVTILFQGRLVYGNYGRYIDHLHLRHSNASIRNAVVLMRHGKISDSRKVCNNCNVNLKRTCKFLDRIGQRNGPSANYVFYTLMQYATIFKAVKTTIFR